MRESPSIIPWGDLDRTVYLVLDDFGGKYGWAWSETEVTATDRPTVIRHLLEGKYLSPVRVVAFNTAEGWSRDVTVDIADELRRRYVEFGEVPEAVLEFMEANQRR